MIKFRPVRTTPTASVKDEQSFDSMEDMMAFLLDRTCCFSRYIGKQVQKQIRICETVTSDPVTCWKNIRKVYADKTFIGFCGE